MTANISTDIKGHYRAKLFAKCGQPKGSPRRKPYTLPAKSSRGMIGKLSPVAAVKMNTISAPPVQNSHLSAANCPGNDVHAESRPTPAGTNARSATTKVGTYSDAPDLGSCAGTTTQVVTDTKQASRQVPCAQYPSWPARAFADQRVASVLRAMDALSILGLCQSCLVTRCAALRCPESVASSYLSPHLWPQMTRQI